MLRPKGVQGQVGGTRGDRDWPDDGIVGGGDRAEGAGGLFQRLVRLGSDAVIGLVIVLQLPAEGQVFRRGRLVVELCQAGEGDLLHHHPLRPNVHTRAMHHLLHTHTTATLLRPMSWVPVSRHKSGKKAILGYLWTFL